MNAIINDLRKDLKLNSNDELRKSSKRFFKEKIKCYGMKTAAVTKIAKEYFKSICNNKKSELFAMCEELWKSGYMEESFVACSWAYSLRDDFKPGDFRVFEKWVKNHVSNWASCDTLCNHTIGTFMELYPDYIAELKKWAKSKNRWERRASAVTLIIPARHGKFLRDIFEITDILLIDEDDLVQKGYGWMLKAASEAHQKEVFDYVMKNKAEMPRTALRYAIEKMSKELRARAMEK